MLDPIATGRLTRHYPFMRGLVVLPIVTGHGVVTVLNGLGWTHTSTWQETVILVISLVATVPFVRYYNYRFGVVRPTRELAELVGVAAVLGAGALVLQFVAVGQHLPVEPLLVFFAAYFGWIATLDGGYRKHWLIPAVACFLLGIRGFVPLERSTSHILFGVVSAGTVALACIWDHVMLVRSLKHVQT